MGAWWFWLILSGCWLLTGILHAANGRSGSALVLCFFAALLFATLGISKRICDQKGDAGKSSFRIIGIAAALLTALLVLLLIFLP